MAHKTFGKELQSVVGSVLAWRNTDTSALRHHSTIPVPGLFTLGCPLSSGEVHFLIAGGNYSVLLVHSLTCSKAGAGHHY